MARDLTTSLVYARKWPFLGRLVYLILKILGLEIPRSVVIGPGLEIAHGGFGIVVHSRTVIGEHVKIYPGVTIGRGDIYRPMAESGFQGVEIGDDAILSSGCKVLCQQGLLRVGRGTVVGANAVLLQSTGEDQIWAGIPARLVGERSR